MTLNCVDGRAENGRILNDIYLALLEKETQKEMASGPKMRDWLASEVGEAFLDQVGAPDLVHHGPYPLGDPRR